MNTIIALYKVQLPAVHGCHKIDVPKNLIFKLKLNHNSRINKDCIRDDVHSILLGHNNGDHYTVTP